MRIGTATTCTATPMGTKPTSHGHAEEAVPPAQLDRWFGSSRFYQALRPILIGTVHGLAGSAAVALLVLPIIHDPIWAMAYLLIFGRWDDRRHDADHGRDCGPGFLFDPVSISASPPRDRGGRAQSLFWVVPRLPDRLRRRALHAAETPFRRDRGRVKITVRGAVQGVGFRPFVYRLATELGLKGWVINSAQGVFIEVEGAPERLADFMRRLRAEKTSPRHHPELRVVAPRRARLRGIRDPGKQRRGRKERPHFAGHRDLRSIACAKFSIRPIVASVIHSPTARIADRVSRSSKPCLTIAPTPR